MSSAYPEMEKRITTAEHMLAALLAGKLSPMQENMEDILTSSGRLIGQCGGQILLLAVD